MKVSGRIIVCCPGGAVSGGPELLHQLVHELRRLRHDAFICYLPSTGRHEVPDRYRKYDVPTIAFDDEIGDLIILPEDSTGYVRRISRAEVAIWWLSVDNYFRRAGESGLKDGIARWRSLLRRRAPLWRLKRYTHFAQSAYARDFLARWGIASSMLTDYLADDHLVKADPGTTRADIIVYNPRKGVARTARLVAANPDLRFIPIQGMSGAEVSRLLHQAKIYVDLGNHPGKDRIPREAAMANCCIITGVQGSAENSEDVPIPRQYKLNDNAPTYPADFRRLAEKIFADFAAHSRDFDEYRNRILQEPAVFRRQVREIFGERLR